MVSRPMFLVSVQAVYTTLTRSRYSRYKRIKLSVKRLEFDCVDVSVEGVGQDGNKDEDEGRRLQQE